MATPEHIEGMAGFERNLKRLEQKLRSKAIRESLKHAAQPMRDQAAADTPRSQTEGGTYGKGHAADHIIIKASTTKRGSEQHASVGPEKDFWYIRFAEFGQYSTPARGMFRRAFDNNKNDAIERFRSMLEQHIYRAVK